MNHAIRAVCLALVALAASCQSHHAWPEERGTVTHVVLCWLKTPGDEAARQKLIDTSRTFETIPGVVSVTAGRALPSTRPVVDATYDVGIVIKFTDEAALRAYDDHPTHKRAVEEVLRPLVGKVVVYDFVAGTSILLKPVPEGG